MAHDDDDDRTQDDLNDITDDDTSIDEDLLLDEEREGGKGDNPLLEAERAAVGEERFSEPAVVDELDDELGDDLGTTDENEVYAKLYQEGAGDNIGEEDLDDLGMHVEEFAADDSADDSNDTNSF